MTTCHWIHWFLPSSSRHPKFYNFFRQINNILSWFIKLPNYETLLWIYYLLLYYMSCSRGNFIHNWYYPFIKGQQFNAPLSWSELDIALLHVLVLFVLMFFITFIKYRQIYKQKSFKLYYFLKIKYIKYY
jgi:hypothetical protein